MKKGFQWQIFSFIKKQNVQRLFIVYLQKKRQFATMYKTFQGEMLWIDEHMLTEIIIVQYIA